MIEQNLSVDPDDYAKYATIEDVLSNKIYQNKKVRVLGTVIQIDKQTKQIYISHNNAKIVCLIPQEYIDLFEENHTCQIIGVVEPFSSDPIIRALMVKPFNSVDQKAYDFAVQKFNEFVFQWFYLFN